MEPVVRYFWEGPSDANWHEPERRLYDCELIYVSASAYILSWPGSEHRLQAGDVAILPPACRHESWGIEGPPAMRHCLHFDWTREAMDRRAPLMCFTGEPFHHHLIHEVPTDIRQHLPLVGSADAELAEVIRLALGHFRAGSSMGELLLWPILQRLLSGVAPVSPTRVNRADRAVFAIKHLIDTRYAEPLDYDDFLTASGLSRSHLCTVFRELVGQPPTQYLGQVRLQHGRRLLSTTTLTVAEVAVAVGIPDANYFTRCFRRAFGVPPTGLLR